MQYRLRTLLILLAVVPPLGAMVWVGGPLAVIPALWLAVLIALHL
jgi:hypothetical protein